MSSTAWLQGFVDMRAISLFSGAGGIDLGMERAGIQTVLQAENDPWCLSVLERHWPDVERLTDVRAVLRDTLCKERAGSASRRGLIAEGRGGPDRQGRRGTDGIDLVYGGFPCQDVSVAGNRAGLGGARSGLWSEFARVLSELRPTWVLVENVPGLLSSNSGRDFGQILGDLDELGYGVAWAVLDARYFGVPQRRRRVFIVGCLGNPDAAAAVLAVCESCGGHPAPGREAGQGLAPCLDDGARGTSLDLPMIAFGGNNTSGSIDLASARSSKANRYDFETDTFLVAGAQRASDGHHGHSSPRGDGSDNLIAQTLSSSYAKTKASGGSHGSQAPVNVLTSGEGVRRLTPLECERLMGWPDDFTKWTADGREIPDSHRYRLCGNGVVSTVAEWIGHRLVAVDRMLP